MDRDLREVADAIGALSMARFLTVPQIGVGGAERVMVKLKTLIADQGKHPHPFVWAEDAITDEARGRVAEEFSGIPHLLVAPDKELGINEEELIAIEQFARRFELPK